jgi:restriction endonuclease Mrr
MGYDGSRRQAGEAVGRSGDEGKDDLIHEDRPDLDTGHTRLNSGRQARQFTFKGVIAVVA